MIGSATEYFEKAGDIDKAKELYRRVVERFLEEGELRRIVYYFEKIGDIDKVIELYRRRIEEHSIDVKDVEGLIELYKKLKELKEKRKTI